MNLRRDKIEKYFDYQKLKENIASILVSHSEKQTLIKKRKNKVLTKNGVKEQITYAPQGKLHEESFYAKHNGATVRRVQLFDDQRQDKTLFNDVSDLDYLVKGNVKWHYIDDGQLYQITQDRIQFLKTKAFSKYEMENKPFYRTSPKTLEKFISKKDKPLPIVKSVRKRFNIDRTLIELPAKDENGFITNENRYANNDSNYIIVYYKNGKKSFARPITFFNAVKNKSSNKPLIPDEVKYKDVIYGLNMELPWLKSGDVIFVCNDAETITNINWADINMLKDRLFKVKGFSPLITPNPKYGNYEYGNTSLLNIRIARADKYPSQKNITDALQLKAFTLSHDKFNAIKVRLNILGEITAKGEECF